MVSQLAPQSTIMNRSEFVVAIVQELRQKEGALGSFSSVSPVDLRHSLSKNDFVKPGIDDSRQLVREIMSYCSKEAGEVSQSSIAGTLAFTPKLLDNLVHFTSTHVTRKASSDEDVTVLSEEQSAAHAELAAAFLIIVTEYLLQADESSVRFILGGLDPAESQASNGSEAETDLYLERAAASNPAASDGLHPPSDEVMAADEDPDDFVFEGNGKGGKPVLMAPACAPHSVTRTTKSLQELRQCLCVVIGKLNYSRIAAISVERWRELQLTAHISKTSSILRTADEEFTAKTAGSTISSKSGGWLLAGEPGSPSPHELCSQWPRFIFLLRDRVVHKVEEVSKCKESALEPILALLTEREESVRGGLLQEECVGLICLASICTSSLYKHTSALDFKASSTSNNNASTTLLHRLWPLMDLLTSWLDRLLDTAGANINSVVSEQLTAILQVISHCLQYCASDGSFTFSQMTCPSLEPSRLPRALLQLITLCTKNATDAQSSYIAPCTLAIELLLPICARSAPVAIYAAHFPPLISLLRDNINRDESSTCTCVVGLGPGRVVAWAAVLLTALEDAGGAERELAALQEMFTLSLEKVIPDDGSGCEWLQAVPESPTADDVQRARELQRCLCSLSCASPCIRRLLRAGVPLYDELQGLECMLRKLPLGGGTAEEEEQSSDDVNCADDVESHFNVELEVDGCGEKAQALHEKAVARRKAWLIAIRCARHWLKSLVHGQNAGHTD